MSEDAALFDVVVVGSGPAAASVTFPLVEAGRQVLILDADDGTPPLLDAPPGQYLDLRQGAGRSNDWFSSPEAMLSDDRRKLSPKLRTPTQSYVFKDFLNENGIVADGPTLAGSLTTGGLSNAWGCGVSAFDDADLEDFPFSSVDLRDSMATVSKRIGLSGRRDDALKDHFGLDEWASPALPMDRAVHRLLRRSEAHPRSGVALGASRNAVLAGESGSRHGCNLSGMCLWGCSRRSLYSAKDDIACLADHPSVTLRSNVVIHKLERSDVGWHVRGHRRGGGEPVTVRARTVVLAAGTLATSAIVLRSLGLKAPRRLWSTPSAAFLVWQPTLARARPEMTTGFAQVSFATHDPRGVSVHGNLFSTINLPASEFLPHIPFSRPLAAAIWRALGPSFAVGNAFFPGSLSNLAIGLDGGDKVVVSGGFAPGFGNAAAQLRRQLQTFFLKLGAILVPGSFVPGEAGSDLHYAATFPMKWTPAIGECDPQGRVAGLDGVYIADAANFSSLPAKPHTLTMMANADRIGRLIGAEPL
ncbi:GMC oxidoreductase [Aurantimonas sp. E1-2-R+4]|uniref:GMC oxidoreductase n=1 Tax=Aurantimonas sp. E1-2-R+4 TaxID=3113714 RepID=UPI002F93F408